MKQLIIVLVLGVLAVNVLAADIPSLKATLLKSKLVMQQLPKINRVLQQSQRMLNDKTNLTVECTKLALPYLQPSPY